MEIEEAMTLPYTRAVERGEDGVYTAWLVELPGAIAEGDTAAEAVASLESGLRMYYEVMIEEGLSFPESISSAVYSGQLTVRLTPYLHARAALFAEVEGVSLNRVLNDAVASYVGLRAPAGVRESSPEWPSKPDARPVPPRRRSRAKPST